MEREQCSITMAVSTRAYGKKATNLIMGSTLEPTAINISETLIMTISMAMGSTPRLMEKNSRVCGLLGNAKDMACNIEKTVINI